MATSSIRKIVVSVALQGKEVLKSLKDGFAQTNKSIAEANKQLKSMSTAMKALIGVAVIKKTVGALIEMSDTYSLMADRIKIFTGSAEASKETMLELAQVATMNNTSLEAIGTTYNRLALALTDVGVSSKQVISITDTLTKTFRLSGSTSSEATAATIQLSQGLASGQLRGQEMRSVLEQNAVMGDILSKTFGRTRGELMKLAETGFFTADKVLTALANNQKDVNKQAAELGVTFGQVSDIIKNELIISVGSLSKDLGAAEKVLSGYKVIKEYFAEMAVGLAAIAAIIFKSKIVLFFKAVGTAIAGLATTAGVASVAIVAGVAAIGVGAVRLYKTWDTSSLRIRRAFLSISTSASEMGLKLLDVWRKVTGSKTSSLADSLMEKITVSKKEMEKITADIAALEDRKKAKPTEPLADFKPKSKAVLKNMSELNASYEQGIYNLSQYNEGIRLLELEGLNKKFKDGSVNVYAYGEAMRRLEVEKTGRDLEAGTISLERYNQEMKRLEIVELSEKMRKGKITTLEYTTAINKLSESFSAKGALNQGMGEYIASVGNLTTGIAGVIRGTFDSLENTIVEFTKTGKANFKDMAYSIIEDINRIIVRAMIVQPLAQGILGSFGGGAAASGSGGAVAGGSSVGNFMTQAKGGAWNGGVQMFAKGGVVNAPTMFGHSTGLGVMGEAGPEAIMPLRRGPDGSLGVTGAGGGGDVIVNIINQAGVDVQESSSQGPNGEKMLDIMITAKVKEGFAKGSYDSTLNSSFGIRRKGR